MTITFKDYERLKGAMGLPSTRENVSDALANLQSALAQARQLPQDAISGDIVTMNSRVLFKDVVTDRKAELTIAYPGDADNLAMKVSVFSPIGGALLGRQCGDIVSWKTPSGISNFEILEVTYQPEAVGHYSL